MKHLFLVLLFFACAAPDRPPATYEKGALRAPPPAPTLRPGVGAPTYDPHHRPQMEPNPRSERVLPQTPESRREPGIWAAKPPVPKDRFRPGKRAHGTPIPPLTATPSDPVNLPLEVEDGFDAMPAEQCWYATASTTRWTTERGITHRVAALTRGEQLCLFYSIYSACLDGLVKGQLDALEAKYATTGRGPSNDDRRLIRMAGLTRDKANTMMARSCAGRNNSRAVKDVAEMVADSTKTLVKGTLWLQ